MRHISIDHRRASRLIGLVCLVMTAAVHGAEPGISKATVAELDRVVEHALKDGGAPGVSVAIARHGRVLYEKGVGYADLENQVPVTPETVFPIGSVTKTMTALAIQQLVAAGKVELDAPVGRYLPDLPSPARDVKIRYLLDHTSGLVNYTDEPGFPHESQAPMSRADILHWFAAKPLLFASGTRWSYTNSGFYLLGLVIEAVSGVSYQDYLQQHVFGPFGMADSSLTSWQPLLPHRAHGYRRSSQGLQNAPRYDPLLPFAAGAVLSTTGDLLKYCRGVFGEGTSATALSEALLVRDSLPDGFVLPYSLGALVLTNFEGHRRIGHPGDVYGFEAQYSYYPDDALAVVVLTNNQNARFPPISIEQKLVRVLLGLKPMKVVDQPLDAALGQRVAGEYEVTNMRFGFDRIAFTAADGTLRMAIGGQGAPSIPLRYQGGTRFVSSMDDEQWIEFKTDSAAQEVQVAFYGFPLSFRRVPDQSH